MPDDEGVSKHTLSRRHIIGAWGAGPFDNDGALDFLGDVADKAGGERDEDFRIDPSTSTSRSSWPRSRAHW